MHAVVYTGDHHVAAVEQPAAPPGPGQVQIAVAFTGICGTDLHIFHGDMDARVTRPAVLGHEMSGVVAALGSGVTGFTVGDPVTVMPTLACGECASCRSGLEHICPRLVFLGIDAPGSMQGLWSVPAELVVPLPAGLALDLAAMVEPVAVAVHDVRRSRLVAGELAVVVGGGPIGLLIALVARSRGARVLLVEPDAGRRALAAELGLEGVDPGHDDVIALVEQATEGAGAAVAFEVSGSAPGITAAVDVLTTRGRLVLVAIHPAPRPVNLHRFFWRELELLGARLYRREDVEEAVRLVAGGDLPVGRLISRVEPWSRAAAAFAALEQGGVMKVLVDCRTGIEE